MEVEDMVGATVRTRAVILTVAAVAGLASLTVPAQAVQTAQSVVVNPNPVDWTPHVLDGKVNAIAQVGNTVYLGGLFSRVRSASNATEIGRSNIVAFDATTGAISSFAPNFNGEITSIVASADGASLYVGGFFTTVNGASSRSLARISTSNGAAVGGFTVPALTGPVRDLRRVGNRLWIAGNFTHVAGVAQPVLATLNATTGARDPFMSQTISGVHNGGTTSVLKIDVTPDGTRLFAIGNFMTVNGQTRDQVAAFDIGGASATLATWATSYYNSTCSSSFNTYMRDLDISPDGAYLVFSTTGAYRGTSTSCDTVARFETRSTAADVRPTWVDYTGGDTTYAVAITGEAVYVGGHQRWMNNPFRGDAAGAGAVSREGIAALDPANGLPLSWNPGRTRGVGVFDMLATSAGLWVGSDTDRIGNDEYHARIAFFPLQGGADLPANQPGRLPGRAYLLGVGTTNDVAGRYFDGRASQATQSFPNGGVNWQSIRGAVMIDGTLYNGQSDGAFVGRSYNGTTFGAPFAVNTSDLLVVDTAWHNDVVNIGGMFFDSGRLYYTVAGQSALYYRYFTPESRVVGAQRFTASGNLTGLNFSTVRSMFVGGGFLFFTTTANGNLQRIPFANGVPSGTVETVSGPGIDGVDWSAQDVFLFTGQVSGANQPPTAVANVSCSGLTCSANANGSADPDGTISSYSWNWGDNTPATAGATASHTYAAAGTYTVTLTVTDNAGATGSTTRSVTVQSAPAPTAIAFVGGATTAANATTHRVNLPAATQAGDGLLLFATNNNPSAPMSAPGGGGTWTLVDTAATGGVVTSVWKAQAGAAPANAVVQLTTPAYAKVSMSVVAYRGTAADPVLAFGRATETTVTTAHTTPTINVPSAGAWVVSYWAQKDSDANLSPLTPPAGVTSRTAGTASGAGRVVALAADSGAAVPTGAYGGRTATAAVASANATMWTIALRPA
jgi:PKD repeat protein